MLTGAIKRIDHVAIVVRSLDDALAFYRDTLGIVPSRISRCPREGVKIAFLPLGDPNGSEIELLEPDGSDTGVARVLEKRGGGLHHICLEVPDIEQALADLRASGAMLLDEAPRPTAEGRGLFLHPKGAQGVLVELVQRAESADAAGQPKSAPTGE
jgi:methylmalonyl-CoA epimerase